MKKGQTLIEVLIAVAVGAILFVGAVSTLVPATKITPETSKIAAGAALVNGTIENVTVWAGGNWDSLLSLSTTSANPYHLITSQSPFTVATGTEAVTVGSTTYTRYFYVDDVYRDSSGNIVASSTSGATDDPSTMEITVASGWPLGTTTTVSFYVTRNGENALSQSTWTGGTASGTVTTVTSTYSTSSNITSSSTLTLTVTSTYGSIVSTTPHYFGWGDLLGWLDFWNNGSGAAVNSTNLTGYASTSAGQISLDCNTTSVGDICGQSYYQVTNDGNGNLAGWAWSDPYGWISFEGPGYQVTINNSGIFHGFAWNDILGWIAMNGADCPSCVNQNYNVETTWTPSLTQGGTLESNTFDTGSNSSQLNSFVWQGTSPCGTCVEFQFAISDSANGPWNFTGPDGTSQSYWDPLGPNTPQSLGSSYANFRYFRYLIKLTSSNGVSPEVTSVAVSWSS